MKKVTKIILAFSLFCFSVDGFSAVIYVNVNTPCNSGCDGSSWALALPHFQDALDIVSSDDEVWVAAGTYKPTKDAFGNSNPIEPRFKTFHLVSEVKYYGGFSGVEMTETERDWNNNITILSGDIHSGAEDAYHIILSLGDYNNTQLDGFHLKITNPTNGDPNDPNYYNYNGYAIYNSDGGGIHMRGSDLRIFNCTFTELKTSSVIYAKECSYLMDNCLIINNPLNVGATNSVFHSVDDGGFSILHSDVKNTQILSNIGKVARVDESSLALENCLSQDNYGFICYGGNSNSYLTLRNCQFTRNQNLRFFNSKNPAFPGATSVMNLINCTFTDNCRNSGASIIIDNKSNCVINITNTILWDTNEIINDGSFTFSNSIYFDGIQNNNLQFPTGVTDGGNNHDIDPMFLSTQNGCLSLGGDYRVYHGSIAFDNGDNAANITTTDLAGNPRVAYGAIDIGCYEYNPCLEYNQNVLFVDASATGNGSGQSWTTALPKLNNALQLVNLCIGIDTILIAEGTYYPDEFSGRDTDDPDETFTLLQDVVIIGGFPSGGAAASARNPSLFPTILSGDMGQDDESNYYSHSDITLYVSDRIGTNSKRIMTIPIGTAIDYTLDGLILTGAHNPTGVGGGLYSGGNPITAEEYHAAIKNCMFYGNHANVGGAASIYNAHTTVLNSIFLGNEGSSSGGAISYTRYPLSFADLNIVNCAFVSNESSNGKAINSEYNVPYNSIFWNGGGSIGNAGGINPQYCDIDDNTYAGSNGNINQDPLFENMASGDLHVSSTSPCLDVGDNNAFNLPLFDLDWNYRISNMTVDIGPYEFGSCPSELEYNALAALYYNTNGESWTNKSNWLQDCNPCTWYGISCNTDGRVTSIDLQVNNLVGSLPVELAHIEFLEHLKLGVNQLSGLIPSQLGQLQYLQNLWLHYNQFDNQSLPTFTSASVFVSILPSIDRMYFYGNNFIGSIPSQYGNFPSLDVLRTFDNPNLAGCYNIDLSKLCSQLSTNMNTDISNGTSLNTDWEQFCSCYAGVCPCGNNKWEMGSGSWDNANKWSKDEVPTPCQQVRIDANGGDDVLLPLHYSSIIYTLDVRLGAQLEIPISSEMLVLTDVTTKCDNSN